MKHQFTRTSGLLGLLLTTLSLGVGVPLVASAPECPIPRGPYDISPACAHALSEAATMPESTHAASLPPDAGEICTTQTIAGVYGFRTTGVSLQPDGASVEFASFGRMVRDDLGNVTSGLVISNAGGTITRLSLTGAVTVNSDCTGSGTSNLSNGAVVHYDFIIVDKGQRLEFMLTEPTGTIGGTQTRL